MTALPTELYRQYDEEGILLYVGIAYSSSARWKQHKRNGGATWINLVARVEIQRYGTRAEALAAERKAIADEGPLHNRAGKVARPSSEAKLPNPRVSLDITKGTELVIRTTLDDWYNKNKTYYGAMQWLATQLGVTRQSIDNYRIRRAIPERHIPTICKLFPRLRPSDIRPEDKR